MRGLSDNLLVVETDKAETPTPTFELVLRSAAAFKVLPLFLIHSPLLPPSPSSLNLPHGQAAAGPQQNGGWGGVMQAPP